MFGLLSQINTAALLAGKHDADKERPAPPLPTPVAFPRVSQGVLSSPAARLPRQPLVNQLIALKSPLQVTHELLSSLYITSQTEVSFKELVPTSFLPPRSWIDVDSTHNLPAVNAEGVDPTPASHLLHNGRPPPNQRDFSLRLQEILLKNEDAFCAISRKPKAGRSPPRLAHFRRFWEGLDQMALYWDTSLDQYIAERHEHIEGTSETESDANSSISGDVHSQLPVNGTSTPEEEKTLPTGAPDSPRKRHKPTVFTYASTPPPTEPNTISSSTEVQPKLRPPRISRHGAQKDHAAPPGTYKGNRTGTGAQMPENHRHDTVRAFLEPISWSWGFSISPPRKAPVLAVKNVLLPIRVSASVWRPPNERERARGGWLEGPVLGVSCRGETGFAEENGRDAVLDLVREIGAMLMIAQERARRDILEPIKRPGEGKWWTTVPRWGGGPGGEVGEIEDSDTNKSTKKKSGNAKGDQITSVDMRDLAGIGRRSYADVLSRRKRTPAENWKVLKPSVGHWDQKVVYSAIGKEAGSEYDEIFLISSLHHHISVVCLRVHPTYLSHLATGDLSVFEEAEKWCRLGLRRTRWYDLFSIADRVELMWGLWGLMGFLARPASG